MEEMHPMTLWEEHKCVARGDLMSRGAKAKRISQQQFTDLVNRIHRLEQTHKKSIMDATFKELTEARKERLDLLGKQHRRKRVLTQKLYYESGNKCYRFLASALRSHKSSLTVHSIRDSQGIKHVNNEAIASQFQMFYTSIYNLPTSSLPPLTRASKIKQFLEQHCPSPIA